MKEYTTFAIGSPLVTVLFSIFPLLAVRKQSDKVEQEENVATKMFIILWTMQSFIMSIMIYKEMKCSLGRDFPVQKYQTVYCNNLKSTSIFVNFSSRSASVMSHVDVCLCFIFSTQYVAVNPSISL
jgi:hypothetical protein